MTTLWGSGLRVSTKMCGKWNMRRLKNWMPVPVSIKKFRGEKSTLDEVLKFFCKEDWT